MKTYSFFCLLISSNLKSVTYTAVGCPGPVNWGGFTAATCPFWNGGTQLTAQPASGDILVIPTGCTVTVNANLNVSNTVTLQIYGTLNFSVSSNQLNMNSGSNITVFTGGSISGSSNSNQIKIGSGGAEWSGPGTSAGPFVITNGSSTLPIELIEFTGSCATSGIHLNWITATELNNDYFSIERSENGLNWISVAIIDGAGTSKILKTYAYTDNNLSDASIFYYRLKQIDFDKSSTTSRLISVTCDLNLKNEVFVFPNPANTEFNVQFKLKQEMTLVLLKVTSAAGRVVFESELKPEKGTNRFSFPINLENGFYNLEFSGNNLGIPAQKLIILSH